MAFEGPFQLKLCYIDSVILFLYIYFSVIHKYLIPHGIASCYCYLYENHDCTIQDKHR